MKLNYLLTLTVLVVSSMQAQIKKPVTIGHRGAKGHVMENSLPSIQKAMDLGVDAIEIDVFTIADGTVVVFHDETLERLTNGNGRIENYTKKELDEIELKGGFSIPTLQQVLDLIDKKVRLNIELKGKKTANPVHKIIQEYIAEKGWKKDDFIISSFNWEELRITRELDIDMPIGVLTSYDLVNAIPEADFLNAEAIHPNYKILTKENVAEMQSLGFKVYTWTVNEPEAIAKIKSFGVEGIITDFPERVK
ncbi:glycerophosphodiester phosphodiesterase [Galbibacter mesophilus]|uniref:glycerophosphodiester phosphodiesterase n=1 Tax=Galbibacter mesophilus TaxID=379069 RepID=UPI00191F1062|nr:glycerophosphodiester phosphodiesterase family protein [Galbibacter mesophilus]MCM5661925.1 glycerophosphodiester phosphodiesterase [Galbibacter mesophilus]